MSKIEDATQLAAAALDPENDVRLRLSSLEEADVLRKELKVGWSKLGLTVEDLEAIRALEAPNDDEPETEVTETSDESIPAENEAPELPADDPTERAAAKAAEHNQGGKPKGGLTRLIESLLMDPRLSYVDIIRAVVAEFPKCQTSTRSIASVAATMRRKGKDVPMRRPIAATPKSASIEEQAADAAAELGEA